MKQKQLPRKYTHPSLQLALAVFLFVISAVLSRGAAMQGWETDVFLWIYGWPDALRPVFFAVTQLGTIYTFFTLVIAFLCLKRFNAVVRVLLSGLMAYLAAGFAKDIWGRARPHEFLADVVNLDYTVRGPGFPSGHMALATALAFVVGRYVPTRFRWMLAVLVACIGLSRLYLGIHAPLDIVGGFAIGWAAYALFCYVKIYSVDDPAEKSKNRRDRTSV